ncbi:STAS domain-containing protein [Nonomuraea sediminis]|uniref:STAS domain-containing protein n=1 Tax=Nonomuraea sediminis TaxID=2835864 RepID=UPI001BDBFC66|nr:STAS domain-containing protein [Nonomuraea sediminis]
MSTIDTGPPATTTVRLTGEIDIFTSDALRQRLLSVLDSCTSVLVLDLSEVSFCDTAGLGALVGIQHRARGQGITVTLAAPQPYLVRLLHITGLDRSLPVVPAQRGPR